jgi:microcystin-dependent protein
VSYTGNGSVDTYSYTFKVFSEDHLQVTVRDTSDVETVLTKTTHYTVTGVGDTSGGSIALVAGAFDWLDVGNDLEVGYILTIRRVVPLTQTTDIRNAGTFYASTHEDQFDKQTMISQMQQDEINRSVKLPTTVSASDFDPTLPSDILDSADRVPKINATGDGFDDVSNWPTSNEIAMAQAYAVAADASAVAADASEAAALASENNAEDWATKTDGIVEATDYSSKAWAIGGTGVTDTAARGAAKEWATETNSTVDGSDYSSKEWAKGTQTRGAASGGSAKDWANYTGGTVDNAEFSAKYYAQNAAASLASAFFRDVVSLTSASSPYTVTQADNGKLLDMNSSGGAITINLPTIAGLSLPFNVALKLTTAGNTVTINRGGSDTINGATTATLTAAGTGLQIAADTDGTPDNWTTLDFGSIADNAVTTPKILNANVTLEKLAAAVAAALVPAGTMLPYGGASVPTGYLFCDGRTVSRTTYADLFTAIGTRWGSGDGSTTFNLPESRYEFLRGFGGIPNVTGTGSAASNNGTFTAHGYTKSGTKVRLSSGTLSGLVVSTDYFVIYVDANTLAFATTRANALAGTKIAISGANSAVIMQYEDPDATSRVASASGGATGDAIGSVQEENYLSHTHVQNSHNHTQNAHSHLYIASTSGGGFGASGLSGTTPYNGTATDVATATNIAATATNQNSGGNETRPQNISAMFIIKT